jgi:hypothetical protein
MGRNESTLTGGNMPTFDVGDFVGVKCEVQPGPFSEERLITIETTDGAISGFVLESELRGEGEKWWVRAKILSVLPESLEVRVRGSFFTTNGIASVPMHLAMAA